MLDQEVSQMKSFKNVAINVKIGWAAIPAEDFIPYILLGREEQPLLAASRGEKSVVCN